MTQRELAYTRHRSSLSACLFRSENALKPIVKIITQNRVGKAERDKEINQGGDPFKKKQPFAMGVKGICLSLPLPLPLSHSLYLSLFLAVPLKPNKFTLAECATRSLGSGNYPHAIEPAGCY